MHAKNESKWLLVNIQDEIMFASHMLNRDTWSDDVVQNLVASGFVFWQVRAYIEAMGDATVAALTAVVMLAC